MIYCLSWIFGLLMGSFGNVCISRLPHDESVSTPRSRCPGCRTPIAARDNVPLFSFLRLRGRCRHCRMRISWQYPLVELSISLLFVANAFIFRHRWSHLPAADALAFYTVVISIIDYRHRIIPDELSLSMLVLGLLLSAWNPFLNAWGARGVVESATAAIAGGGGMLALAWLGEKIFKQEALGGGDVKLVAGCSALLGWPGLVGTVFLGSLFGAGAGASLILAKKLSRRDTLPFGPFLMLGAYLSCFFPSGWLRFIFP
jgi:leader peptidase (prepilin peptidase) / N-methyltransferase